jgi:CPA1 family monovalent cation:H+ antiporter
LITRRAGAATDYADPMTISGGALATAFLILLGFAVAFALLARRIELPYPVVLLIGGLALSFVPGTPRFRLDPNFVFYIVLPPLLYSAAWLTSWHDFSHHLVSILSLAFGLVMFTILGVAAAANLLFPGFGWTAGAILGAVVAPTDPVAASAIFSRLGLPRRLVDVIEGESLINDATALVAVELATALAVSGAEPHFAAGVVRLLYVTGAAIAIGAAIAVAVDWLERRIDDGQIEIAISLMIPYAVYLAADAVHASGVVAVVTCGLMLTRGSAEFFSPAVRLQVYAVWNATVFILNGVVFVLIGLQLRGVVARLDDMSLWRIVGAGALFSLVVIVLRFAWIAPGARLSFTIRRRLLRQPDPYPTAGELLVVGWSGMRGVVSLAAAFALPVATASGAPFPGRDLIVFLTFSVVVFTLVVQTLTLAPLIRRLGLEGGGGLGCEEQDARRIAIDAAIRQLEEERQHDRPEYAGLYDDLAQHYRDRLAGDGADANDPRTLHHDRYRALARELIDVQRREVLKLRGEGRINDDVLRRIERDLDLEAVRLE